MKSKLLILAFLSAFMMAFESQAGRESHGGNVVICKGAPAVILDYYHATLPTLGNQPPQLIDITGRSSEQAIEAVMNRLDSLGFFTFKKQILTALEQIGPMKNWISADLKQVDDSNEPYFLPAGCERRTAAIRQSGVVMYGDPAIINLLSPAQQGLLMLHEALYLIASNSKQETSENVRTFMRVVLNLASVPEDVMRAISELGGSDSHKNILFESEWNLLRSRFDGVVFSPEGSLSNPLRGKISVDTKTHVITLTPSTVLPCPKCSAVPWALSQKIMRQCWHAWGHGTEINCQIESEAPNPVESVYGGMILSIDIDRTKPVNLQILVEHSVPDATGPQATFMKMVGGSQTWSPVKSKALEGK